MQYFILRLLAVLQTLSGVGHVVVLLVPSMVSELQQKRFLNDDDNDLLFQSCCLCSYDIPLLFLYSTGSLS